MSSSGELLPTINYRHLISLDRSLAAYESAVLLHAATTFGFFYLDLRANRQHNEIYGEDVNMVDVDDEVDVDTLEMGRLEEVVREFFGLEMEEKMRYRITGEGQFGAFG